MQFILWPIITWLLREIVIKFLIFTALFSLVAWLTPHLVGYLGSLVSIDDSLGSLSGGVIYWLRLFAVPQGLALVLGAYATRFLIRRLPIIG